MKTHAQESAGEKRIAVPELMIPVSSGWRFDCFKAEFCRTNIDCDLLTLRKEDYACRNHGVDIENIIHFGHR